MTVEVLEFGGRKGRMVGLEPSFHDRLNRLLLNDRSSRSLFLLAVFFGRFLGEPANVEAISRKTDLFGYGFGDHYSQDYLYIHGSCDI
jgi:hypothetical protein